MTAAQHDEPSTEAAELHAREEKALKVKKANKGTAFWMIMLSLATSTFLSALDLTAVTTVSPIRDSIGQCLV